MNKELTLRWCNEILGQFFSHKRLLAWDSYEAHLTDNVKKPLTKSKIETVMDGQNTFKRQMLCGISLLRILTGKKHPKIKLQRLRKIRIWTFGSLVHQINSF